MIPKLERGALRFAVLLILDSFQVVAQSDAPSPVPAIASHPAVPELTDLSLANLFTAGWDEPFAKRPHPDGAPDLTLLRVQSNLLLSSMRTDYFFERTTDSSRDRSIQFVNQLVEYSLNRRLMLAIFGNCQWNDRRVGEDEWGGSYGALTRLQLIDLRDTSYAFNLRVAAPRTGTEEQTVTSFALAGWHDLTPLGFDRVGLYLHVQEETLLGSSARGARQNALTYDLSLAKTWTSPDARFGNFSTFLETYARTDLDGPEVGHTVVSLTPGLRFNIHHHHVFMLGIELPVTHPKPYEQIVRFTYIYAF